MEGRNGRRKRESKRGKGQEWEKRGGRRSRKGGRGRARVRERGKGRARRGVKRGGRREREEVTPACSHVDGADVLAAGVYGSLVLHQLLSSTENSIHENSHAFKEEREEEKAE